MNVIFHLASAMVTAALVHLLLKRQRERDVLRMLVQVQRGRGRVYVDSPDLALERFAKAFGLPFHRQTRQTLRPRRIQLPPVAEFFLRAEITLIRCKNAPDSASGLVIECELASDSSTNAEKLREALGQDVQVTVYSSKETR